ncbi:MAG: hypothetical protein E7623_03860 [Ruminococcaceae bacterium]|nr:hypothetical protein [Oscillospiraceae bacterium]
MKIRKYLYLKLISALILIALALCVIFVFVDIMKDMEIGSGNAVIENMENVLKRGAAACYAAEGAYPPTAEYLINNYCVGVDLDRYAVFYEIFSENIMPEITVVER